jgi:ABC-type uncharacterized transport system substrate-binding protein
MYSIQYKCRDQTLRLLGRIIAGLIACLAPGMSMAAEQLPRSLLVLEQSDVTGPFYTAIVSGLRSTLNSSTAFPISIYVEDLDLNRFNGSAYEEGLQVYFKVKYHDKPVGIIVAVGSAALEYVLRWRVELWPGIPVVFAMVDEPTVTRLSPPPDVTGTTVRSTLRDAMITARAVVPNLERIAIVGDPLEGQTVFRHFKDEIPIAAADLAVIDLTGLPMTALRKRVAVLPDHTAILYTSIYSDGAGTYYPPSDALVFVAEVANRPIVISAETFLGRGGIGGFLMVPTSIGKAAAQLALRILEGESPSSIPTTTTGNIVRPIFDWRQLQRWGVKESNLPPGSEIRFRDPTAWEQYRWQIVSIAAVVLLQTALIIGQLYEHRRRRHAEVERPQRMLELAHINRHSTAGELSASIAHELNQPLGAILSNAEAAELMLNSPSPNLEEVKEILADIRRDDERASEVIRRLRRLLKKTTLEAQDIDLNKS